MIAQNLSAVRARIESAAIRAGRDPRDIMLVAVTKDVGADIAREAAGLGALDLGENRVQELRRKQDALAGIDVRWHMIGTLQRNKIPQIVGRVVLIHSVDSAALGEAVGSRARARGLRQDVLVEVNAAEETTKHGVAPADALDVVRALTAVPGVRVRGLMTIAPQGDEQAARHAFRSLRQLRDAARKENAEVTELSIGMTEDFEIAIEEGATIVRIGTAIFGPRAARFDANAAGREK
jgi:pyridoxal phosphate enzyme (YggS family)